MRAGHRPPRPKALLDAIEAETPVSLAGHVWRVVTEGFDPLRPGRAGGRWDDGSFDVLYTSRERDGAMAEAWFHASRGQPVLPSKVSKRLHRLQVDLDRVLDLATTEKLSTLGMNTADYGRLSYVRRVEEYPTPRQIGEIAWFYEYEAIIVPNARWPASNVVILTEHVRPGQIEPVHSEPVDLAAWEKARGRR